MPLSDRIEYAATRDLFLDPKNPRLGRGNTADQLSQERILELMSDWALEELALSFLTSGFWPQEALIVVEESIGGKSRLVVVEGNRRLAALKSLEEAFANRGGARRWRDLVAGAQPPRDLFERVPYIRAGSREDVAAFIGFRHVSGIKEWRPAEKAEYIARLIDKGMSYDDVRKRIGSKTPAVRQHYITYQLLLQMENQEEVSLERVEARFSVLYLSLRSEGTQQYLQIDIKADPKRALQPVPPSHLRNLVNFARWVFGDQDHEPLVPDSRKMDDFGEILANAEAVAYLERTDRPSFEMARRLAGGDVNELRRLVDNAADSVEESLSRAHLHTEDAKLQMAVERLRKGCDRLFELFPRGTPGPRS